MELFSASAAWLIFLLSSLLSIGKNYFYRADMPRKSAAPHPTPHVTIIIPARNEELNIERCVSSFLKQSYPRDRLEIIVVDDNSTDSTAAVVRKVMDDHPELKLITAEELPAG